ncbi:MAG: hypothetical protein IJQ59_00770 [Bacteroidaceae bacterium]|nr:hypothetical protein [Bacteroidales bacterium]MBR0272608.1 hypothetical protein [Bacteroidaceae bacterium]
MKKFYLLLLAIMIAVTASAQLQLATLNHNDSITVYYGASALQSAHAAAVNGDIITLSPGAFNSVNITKAITLRGAGMFPDTVAGTDATVLNGDFTLTIEEDSLHSFYMEGINCAGQYMNYSKVYSPMFIKCYFREINYTTSNTMRDAQFINCIITRFTNSGNNRSAAYARNTQFINSVIMEFSNGHYGANTLVNSIASLSFYTEVQYVSARNSILYYNYSLNPQVNAYTSYNSIGINLFQSNPYFNYTGIPNHNLHNFNSFESVFKTFRGTYNDGIDFQLVDSVAATCLGTDGTQVGIYGGIMPFDPSVRNPLIKKCNVAQRSTADGKLAVDIEIVSED